MKNSIAERILDFLKDFPPFDILSKAKLFEISSQVQINYFEKGQTIFKKDSNFHQYFYIVRNGAIGLYRVHEEKRNLVDICDGGDIFGLRPLIIKENYILEAIANEESIVYGIPIKVFETVVDNNKKVSKYLLTSFATNTFDPYTAEDSGSVFGDYIKSNQQDISNFQTASYTKKPIKCKTNETVQEAAIIMSEHKIGSIVVVDNERLPIGILSNEDFKNKIATGKFPITTSIDKVMTSPVVTCEKNISIAEAQLLMIKHKTRYLCVTKDGTDNSKLKGILSQHDIIVSLGNNPDVLLKEINRANRTKTLRAARLKTNILLKGYLEQNIPISHILKIISEINDAVSVRVISLALKKMPTPPPVKFAWISLGSQGRKEQLLFTDQDNALIFEDVEKIEFEKTQAYFLTLSKLITKSFHKIGFEYCPAEMMASNPKWCDSISSWKKQFEEWIVHPDDKAILLSSIFFDFEYVYGDKELVNELSTSINKTVGEYRNFFTQLGTDAIKSASPLGFFKQFLVEQNGDHKDFFNIKNRALLPLIDAARILVLYYNIAGINNTAARFVKLAEVDSSNKEIYESCAYAFRALIKFKTKQGFLHNDSGKFIELATLRKEEKLKLKRCFKPIREVQELLVIKFRLGNMV